MISVIAATVQLSSAAGLPVSVPYSIAGTASLGVDYTLSPSSPIVIPIGQAGQPAFCL